MKVLNTDIQYLSGVGPKRAELFRKELNISSIQDLIYFYPTKYSDRTLVKKISEITPSGTSIQFQACVIKVILYDRNKSPFVSQTGEEAPLANLKFNLISRMTVVVSDGSGTCNLTFFKGIKYVYYKLTLKTVFLFCGKPGMFGGILNFVHPEIDKPLTEPYKEVKSIPLPTYPSTTKLKTSGVTNKVFSQLVAYAINMALHEVEETIPEYVRKQKNLMDLQNALLNIHFPKNKVLLSRAEYRLKFEELFFLQLSLQKQKYIKSRNSTGIKLPRISENFNLCYGSLPYSLTNAQKKVLKEIHGDLTSGRQMNRLLQGDVGSGKTAVAILTCLIAVDNGYQACLMAPTEVLAQQHYYNMLKYLENTRVQVGLLTGSTTAKERKTLLPSVSSGEIQILVGTHAILEDTVSFDKLAIAVIDEQHRFGVEQRSGMWTKNSIAPHILVMTATPIPRTLAMTLYGDLDVSIIDELPPGRKEVKTILVPDSKRYSVYRFIKKQIKEGRQIFIVYPLIFENEKSDYQNIETGYEKIMEEFPLPDYKVAMVHGKQSASEKAFNMDAFIQGRADILVSTTVIEVGVDVPNASVMIIENAERFGLSQLHQLRGRVGRGSSESFCILIKGLKVSKESSARLELLCRTQDGFTLSEEDMKMRGPGDLDGTKQSGLPITLNIASLAKDGKILSEAADLAKRILENDPALEKNENKLLLKEISKNKYNIKNYSKIS